MKEARKGGAPLFLFESGNFLFKGKPGTKAEEAAAHANARRILRAYRTMGYDAVLPAGNDFAAGLPFLNQKEESGVPFTCLNLVSADGGRAVFPRSRSILRGETRALAVGVLGEGAIPRDDLSALGWKILPAEETLARFLRSEEANAAGLIVILSRLSPAENLAIARSAPRPVILLSPPSRTVAAPVFASGSAIFQSRDKGTHLLEVSCGSKDRGRKGTGFVGAGTVKRPETRRRILLEEMTAMEEKRRAIYRKTVESYDNAIRDAEGRRELSHRWIALDAKIPDDPQVAAIFTERPRSPNDPGDGR